MIPGQTWFRIGVTGAFIAVAAAPPVRAQSPNRVDSGPAAVNPARLTLVSLISSSARGLATMSRLGERVSGDWQLKLEDADSQSETLARFALQGILRLPRTIDIGQDFAFGLCGAATLGNQGGAPPAADAAQHTSTIRAALKTATSDQRVALPTTGLETSVTQSVALIFRVSSSDSQPPGEYVYTAEYAPSGTSVGGGPRWLLTPAGASVGENLTPLRLVVELEETLRYPSERRSNNGRAETRTWIAEYRALSPGETPAVFADAAPVGECPAVRLDSTLTQERPGDRQIPQSDRPITNQSAPAIGDQRITLADLQGRKADEAQQILASAGLQAQPRIGRAASSAEEEYTVIAQQPPAGTLVQRGDAIALELFGPRPGPTTVEVPRVEGRTAAQANDDLARAGLKLRAEIGPAPESELQANTVKSQDPAPGSKVPAGTEINVVLFGFYSRGK